MAVALHAYSECLNKTEAYRVAYNCSNMKPETVNRAAHELFEHPVMAQAIAHLRATVTKQTEINAAWVLKRAALLADFNINKFIKRQSDGTAVYDFSTATDDDWYCISEYTVDTITKGRGYDRYEVERVKLRGESKIQALRLVGEHVKVGAFKQTVEHTGLVGVAAVSADEYKAARLEMLADDDC